LRLADHAVDLAFTEGMREAAVSPAAQTLEAKALFARVSRAETQIKSDQELIDDLKKSSAKAKASEEETQKQLNILQAQMELDKDELEAAKADLLRSGADPLSRIQRQFARYQTAQQQADASRAQMNFSGPDAPVESDNLIGRFSTWRAQRDKKIRLQQARDAALQKREHLQQKLEEVKAAPAESNENAPHIKPSADSSDDTVLASLRGLSAHQKNLAALNQRIQDHQDLADVYGNWMVVVQASQKANFNGIIRSALYILLIVMAVYLANLAVDHMFADLISDRRRLKTLRVVVRFALQVAGVLIILFVLFGVPSQMPTIVGLAGAGLTVALKDFIVGFIGWFVLMGRNGIRVGDWVEIQGVVGEVIEISLFRTVLLETGNWNDAGHPTGRKVAFTNGFAIEGHFFNFSTSGQWLWDELQILVPASQNPYPILDAIQKMVTDATEGNAHKAEEEWKHAIHRERIGAVSAAPAISLRPTASGVEVHVRYITSASERYSTRTRLYQEIVALLHQKPSKPAASNNPVVAGA
jgi:small-conductance mechanosensitive channel